MANWYETGYDGIKKEDERMALGSGPDRFWLPVGSSKDIVLLDDVPFAIHEHCPRFAGEWRNWTTCSKGTHPEGVEAMCCKIMGEASRYYTGYFTCIDCSQWTDKKGNVHQFELKFFQAKLGTLKKFDLKKKGRGSLVGQVITVTRSGDKTPTCGDDFDILREVSGGLQALFPRVSYRGKLLSELYSKALAGGPAGIAALGKVFSLVRDGDTVMPMLTPFNYAELLMPRSNDEIKAWLSGVHIETDSRNATPQVVAGSKADDDVPF